MSNQLGSRPSSAISAQMQALSFSSQRPHFEVIGLMAQAQVMPSSS
jgi:hypothetical protein